MKQCSKCLIYKNESYFHKNKNGKYISQCNECIAKKKAKWLSNLVAWYNSLKFNKPCADCGQIYETFCMDYDHIPERGEKIKEVSRMISDCASRENILAEIAKCDLICILCHKKRTYFRLNENPENGKSYSKYCKRNIEIINQFKSVPCAICNIKYDSYNMQLDHIDPTTKLYDVAGLIIRNLKI